MYSHVYRWQNIKWFNFERINSKHIHNLVNFGLSLHLFPSANFFSMCKYAFISLVKLMQCFLKASGIYGSKVLLVLGSTTSSVWSFLLALHSEINSDRFRVPRIHPGSAMCKASSLPAVLSLQTLDPSLNSRHFIVLLLSATLNYISADHHQSYKAWNGALFTFNIEIVMQ